MVTRLNHLIFAYHQKRCKTNAFYLFPQALQRFFFIFLVAMCKMYLVTDVYVLDYL